MEVVWPLMPWDGSNDISSNHIHDVMQLLGDGGSIYTLGPQGNQPYPKGPSGKAYPVTPVPPLKVLPPSTMHANYIHDSPGKGVLNTPGFGSHSPGALYNDEGSTNWAMVGNLVIDTIAWLQGCRYTDGWIGYMNFTGNIIACDDPTGCRTTGNVDSVCPLVDERRYNLTNGSRATLPADVRAIIASSGPRPRKPPV